MKICIWNKNGVMVDSFALAFVRVVTMFLSIICIKILSVEFSLQDYGTYSQAILIVTTITSFSILGLTDATNYYFNQYKEDDRNSYISTIFCIQYVVGSLCGIGIIVFQDVLELYFGNEQLYSFFLWIALMPLCANLLAMLQVLYISIGRIRVIVIRNLIISILRLCIFVCACYVTHDVKTIIILTLICDIGQVLYFKIGISRSGLKIDIKNVNRKYIKPILKYSLPMASYVILNALMRDVDKLMIGNMADTEQLALYTNASRILPFDLLTVSLATVLLPHITQNITNRKFEVVQRIYGDYLNFGILTTLILVSGTIIFAKEAMLFLYDVKYLDALNIFIIYLFVDLLRIANVSLILSASGNTKRLMYISICAFTANVILNYLLFLCLGIVGPAIATVMVTLATNLYLMYVSSMIIHESLFKLLNYKSIILVIGEIIILGIFFKWINCILEVKLVSSSVRLILCYSSLIVFIFLLNRSVIVTYLKRINSLKSQTL